VPFSNRGRISVGGSLRCLFSSWLAALHAAALYFLEKAILATRPPIRVAAPFGRVKAVRRDKSDRGSRTAPERGHPKWCIARLPH
jgi:hypothetical protein